MTRNIFLFLDGTRCKESTDSNITKIKSVFDTPENICRYLPGIGTYSDLKFFQEVVASELHAEAVFMYQRLVDLDVDRDDNIFIVGYSRGAITARILAQMLTSKGAYRSILARQELKFLNVGVQFLGLFEPVIGFPYIFRSKAHERQAILNKRIKNYVEILSIDETWMALKPHSGLPIYNKKSKADTPNIAPSAISVEDNLRLINNQATRLALWMPGGHSDIGGQHGDMAISSVAATIMTNEIISRAENLPINEAELRAMEDDSELNQEIKIAEKTNVFRKIFSAKRRAAISDIVFVHPLVDELVGKKGIARNKFWGGFRSYKINKKLSDVKRY